MCHCNHSTHPEVHSAVSFRPAFPLDKTYCWKSAVRYSINHAQSELQPFVRFIRYACLRLFKIVSNLYFHSLVMLGNSLLSAEKHKAAQLSVDILQQVHREAGFYNWLCFISSHAFGAVHSAHVFCVSLFPSSSFLLGVHSK